jgi:hypothetical protein
MMKPTVRPGRSLITFAKSRNDHGFASIRTGIDINSGPAAETFASRTREAKPAMSSGCRHGCVKSDQHSSDLRDRDRELPIATFIGNAYPPA